MSTVAGLAARVLAATPAPTPDPLKPDLSPYQVSPGLVGFLAIFAVALATVLLFLSLTKHLRRVRRNEERRAAAGQPVPGSAEDVSAEGPAGGPGAPDAGPHGPEGGRG